MCFLGTGKDHPGISITSHLFSPLSCVVFTVPAPGRQAGIFNLKEAES